MRHLFTSFFVLLSTCLFAQKATLHIEIKNTKTTYIYFINQLNSSQYDKPQKHKLIKGKLVKTFTTTKFTPISMIHYWGDESSPKWMSYDFYLLPDDDIYFTADADKTDFDIKVKGKGAANNQPLAIKDFKGDKFENDTLPDNVIYEIKKLDSLNKKDLDSYINKHNPSKSFINYWKTELEYKPVWDYHAFSTAHKFKIGTLPHFENIYPIWQKRLDSALATIKLNNVQALNSYSYRSFIKWFVIRKKEELWYQADKDSVGLAKEWYTTLSVNSAMKLFSSDTENNVRELIITKYFTGKVAEYLYADLLIGMMNDKKDNAVPIYERFIAKYPKSKYIPKIQPMINEIKKNFQRKWNDKMVIVKSSENFKTFEDVLSMMKGKTVLLDMWGTWCGPCRSEIQKNSQPIKNHFKEKDVTFLYIANFDEVHVDKWKELIPFYNLEGLHILANNELTEDIMKKSGGTGYPTYIIIKKDGSYELSKAGYPMNRDILIKQIEADMK